VSDINYSTINENFPVAGQDNDTQVFRDNFNSIKTALSVAKNEIGALEGTSGTTNTGAARRSDDNDFNGYTISNVVLQNVTQTAIPSAADYTTSELNIEFQSGLYQSFKLANNVTCLFSQFPSDTSTVGKVVLELYSSDDSLKKITFSLSGSGASTFKKHNFPALAESGSHDLEVSSSTDPVIIEVWRHSTANFYINYIGLFE